MNQATTQPGQDKLWTPTFIALNLILFLNFCNISIFFRFDAYLKSLGMAQSHIGLVIGLFSLATLIVRPAISPFLQPANARRWIFWGVVFTVGCLLAYRLPHSFFSMSILRLAHGAFYVLMSTAAMAAITGCIPQSRSGLAFGVVGIVALLPFAVVPPVLPALESLLGGYVQVLTVATIPVGCIALLLPFIRSGQDGGGGGYAFNRHDLAANLRQPVILAMLGVSLLMYSAFSTLFYYVQGYAKGLSIGLPGLFFTLATVAEIVTRLALGSLLDRVSKRGTIILALAVVSAAYVALIMVSSAWMFFGLAVVFGLAWGVAVPAVSAVIFDVSEPRFRALNTNLGFEAMQGGYFVGPLLGGITLAAWGYGTLFAACAGVCLLGLALAAVSRTK